MMKKFLYKILITEEVKRQARYLILKELESAYNEMQNAEHFEEHYFMENFGEFCAELIGKK